jgi:hypothetical protein
LKWRKTPTCENSNPTTKSPTIVTEILANRSFGMEKTSNCENLDPTTKTTL